MLIFLSVNMNYFDKGHTKKRYRLELRRVKHAGKLISDISSHMSNDNWGICLTMFPPGIGVDARTCNLGCSPWPPPFYIAQKWPASPHVQMNTHSLAEEQNRHTYTPVSRNNYAYWFVEVSWTYIFVEVRLASDFRGYRYLLYIYIYWVVEVGLTLSQWRNFCLTIFPLGKGVDARTCNLECSP